MSTFPEYLIKFRYLKTDMLMINQKRTVLLLHRKVLKSWHLTSFEKNPSSILLDLEVISAIL